MLYEMLALTNLQVRGSKLVSLNGDGDLLVIVAKLILLIDRRLRGVLCLQHVLCDAVRVVLTGHCIAHNGGVTPQGSESVQHKSCPV